MGSVNFCMLVMNFLLVLTLLDVECHRTNREMLQQNLTDMCTKHRTEVSIRLINISIIHEDTFKNCKDIKQLRMTKTSVTSIRLKTFRNLHKLRDLDLSNNEIDYLFADIFQNLTSLIRFNLYNNKLKVVPARLFRDVEFLETLNLARNYISDLNETIFMYNSKLNHLILSSNYIEDIPINLFNNLSVLRVLNLDQNRIVRIRKDLFQNLSALEYLTLAFNAIAALETGTFDHNPKLQRLHLTNNEITMLQNGLFKNLKQLNEISLGDNKISFIEENIFSDTKALKSVYLHRNRLKYLAASVLKLEGLQTLTLYENPWHCDCRLKDLIIISKNFHTNYNYPSCETPAQMNWNTLNVTDLKCDSTNTTCTHISRKTIFSCKNNAMSVLCKDYYHFDGTFESTAGRYKLQFTKDREDSQLTVEYNDMIENESKHQCLEFIWMVVAAVTLSILFIVIFVLSLKMILRKCPNETPQNVSEENVYSEPEIVEKKTDSSLKAECEVENSLYGMELR